MSETEQQRLISSFLEIAVGRTVETARQFLQATSWKLEDAILLFYAGDQNLRNLQNDYVEEDQVRAPLPVVRDALYGSSSSRRNHVPASREETNSLIWGQGHGTSSATASEAGAPRDLASLYKPPFHMMFKGSFDQAKASASDEDKWLLVNLQCTKEFASHTLNRDTWGDEALSLTITNNFVFWQVEQDTSEGLKVRTFYKIETLPVVLVIDPTTGQKMRMWCGMIDGETLLEELVPFMDAGPKQQLAASMFKKHPRSTSSTTEDKKLQGALESVKTETLSANTTPVSPPPAQEPTAVLESVKTATLSEKDQACSSNIAPTFPPLPQEPTGDRSVLCRVCVRLPDGRRIVRNFLKTEPIRLLWSFCYSQLQESEEKKPFKLVETMTPSASKNLDYNSNTTFEQSGLANSMVLLSWE